MKNSLMKIFSTSRLLFSCFKSYLSANISSRSSVLICASPSFQIALQNLSCIQEEDFAKNSRYVSKTKDYDG
jgi:hypothetical protein